MAEAVLLLEDMNFSDIANLVGKYTSASATQPPPDTERDFQQVAQGAPQGHLAGGLASAFNSDQTPPFGQMVSGMFSQSNGQQKAGILNQLIAAAGAGVGGSGILGGLSGMLGRGGQQVTPDQAQQIQPEAVNQLAEHAKQQDPSIVDQASQFYAQHPTLVQALGAGSLALIMSHMSKRSS